MNRCKVNACQTCEGIKMQQRNYLKSGEPLGVIKMKFHVLDAMNSLHLMNFHMIVKHCTVKLIHNIKINLKCSKYVLGLQSEGQRHVVIYSPDIFSSGTTVS